MSNPKTTKVRTADEIEFDGLVAAAQLRARVKRAVAKAHRASPEYHTDMMHDAVDRNVRRIYGKSRFAVLSAIETARQGVTSIDGLTVEGLAPEETAPEAPKATAPAKGTAPAIQAPAPQG